MSKRAREADLRLAMHFLAWSLAEIRTAAYQGDSERARGLADAVHNLPTDVLRRSFADALVDVRRRCEQLGEVEFFERALEHARGTVAAGG